MELREREIPSNYIISCVNTIKPLYFPMSLKGKPILFIFIKNRENPIVLQYPTSVAWSAAGTLNQLSFNDLFRNGVQSIFYITLYSFDICYIYFCGLWDSRKMDMVLWIQSKIPVTLSSVNAKEKYIHPVKN